METRRIGSLDVSVVGLGCNNFGSRIDVDAASSVVQAALDAGISFFDTADVYGGTKSEEYLGWALGSRRDEVVIATKFGSRLDERRGGARPGYVIEACDASLRRLGRGYIDLYQLHWPDPETPIEETLGALNQLVQEKKVREIGCSNFTSEMIREADDISRRNGWARFVSVQNEYSLLHRQPECGVIPECMRLGLSFIPYFPLASGLLTGKYRRGMAPPRGSRLQSGNWGNLLTEENLDVVERLIEFASSRGHTPLELAISWLAARPSVVSVIAGATKPEQARSNASAADWKLTAEELAGIDALEPKSMVACADHVSGR